MRYLLLVLFALITAGCAYEVADGPEDNMPTNRNPAIGKVPPLGIPQVAPVIPRDGLWSGYNQLGYEAKYGPDQRATQTILKLDEWGPPEIWTVSLFLRQKFTAFDGFGVKARINFGSGGSTQIVEMDWLNGAQISLPMNAVNVEAIFTNVEVTTEGSGLSCGVQLSRGTRGGSEPPRITIAERLTVSAGTSSDPIVLPAFVGNVYATPVGNLNVARVYAADQFLQLRRGTTGLTSASIDGSRLGAGFKLPVAGEARTIVWTNGSGNDVIVNIIGDVFG